MHATQNTHSDPTHTKKQATATDRTHGNTIAAEPTSKPTTANKHKVRLLLLLVYSFRRLRRKTNQNHVDITLNAYHTKYSKRGPIFQHRARKTTKKERKKHTSYRPSWSTITSHAFRHTQTRPFAPTFSSSSPSTLPISPTGVAPCPSPRPDLPSAFLQVSSVQQSLKILHFSFALRTSSCSRHPPPAISVFFP